MRASSVSGTTISFPVFLSESASDSSSVSTSYTTSEGAVMIGTSACASASAASSSSASFSDGKYWVRAGDGHADRASGSAGRGPV